MNTKLISITFILLFHFNASCQELFPFRIKNTWCFVDKNDSVKSHRLYNFVLPFYNGKAIVKLPNNKFGVIDYSENFIIPPNFDTIVMEISYYRGIINNIDSLYNFEGKKIVKPWHCFSSAIHVGCLSKYELNGKFGLITINDENLEDKSPPIYSSVIEYSQGTICAKLNNKWGTITCSNEIITEFILDSIDISYDRFDEGIIHKYYIGNSIGFLNSDGIIITEPKYLKVIFYNNGFTLVETFDHKFIYINNKGKEFYRDK